MEKKAIITGITGQDGSYLARFLLSKNYIVHGIKRRTSLINTDRIDDLINNSAIYNKIFFFTSRRSYRFKFNPKNHKFCQS